MCWHGISRGCNDGRAPMAAVVVSNLMSNDKGSMAAAIMGAVAGMAGMAVAAVVAAVAAGTAGMAGRAAAAVSIGERRISWEY